jgi:hypothetical protein
MDARLIPSVFPAVKKVIQLEGFKQELKRFENQDDCTPFIERRKIRLKENIAKLEKELGYDR